MFCAYRCVLVSLGDAVDLAEQFPARTVGVVVDTYNVWWDSRVAADIARASGRIVGYQLGDWLTPLPADALLGRGQLGDGSVDFRRLTGQVLAAGYDGYAEVEIFNQEVWDTPAEQVAATVKTRFAQLLG
jgi:sugar phosphate isomerase/epimerase